MKKEPVIAVVGATGLVGNEIVSVLDEMELPHEEIKLLASTESAGEVYKIGQEEISVDILEENSLEGVDIAIFATPPALSAKYVPLAAEAGAVALDLSEHFRMNENVPLIVPEVNYDRLRPDSRIIASPSAAAIQLSVVLSKIHDAAGLKRVVVSAYEAVSSAGKHALDELWAQTLAIFNQTEVPIEAFQHQIAFNCIPQVDLLLEDGYTKEEQRIINETKKVLNLPDLAITATAVRIPVLYSHCESVNVETNKDLSPEDLMRLLSNSEGIQLCSVTSEYPMPLGTVGTDTVHVGRIRRDYSLPHALNLWIVADNVRRGAALNVVQTAKRLIEARQH